MADFTQRLSDAQPTVDPTTAEHSKPVKIPQPHGGALNAGGTPGNRGGRGYPPSEVRRIARDAFAARVPILERIAEGRIVVPLEERCASCGHEPESQGPESREKAIERAA